jgi:hypothetical protein
MPNDQPTGKDLLASVSGLAPEAAAAFEGNDTLFSMPVESFVVTSDLKHPDIDKMNGTVTLKFPNVGDDMRIERLTAALGNRNLAEVFATISVCCVKAPAGWYSLLKDGKTPILDLERLPDMEALADLYIRFNKWRGSFR